MKTSAFNAIEEWAAQPHISARSVLVTIIGDTLIPVASSVWMSQMLALTEVFGFSDRLVRTSMTRLVNEGWLTNERVGRQSRYHLTELALRESSQADGRIYGLDHVDWTGEWTLLFLADLEAQALCEVIVPEFSPAVATASFLDIENQISEGFFAADSDGAEIALAHKNFVERHSTIATPTTSMEAYALRTMLVHDLRRIRLRWPDSFEAAASIDLASERYIELSGAAVPALSGLLDVDYPNRIPQRFEGAQLDPVAP